MKSFSFGNTKKMRFEELLMLKTKRGVELMRKETKSKKKKKAGQKKKAK